MKLKVCINFFLGLLILAVPSFRLDAIIKIILIITLCVLFFVNNRRLIAQIKGNEKNKIEIAPKILVISIGVGIMVGLVLLKCFNC